ncbi:MAG TPA: ABC transporter permease [Sediminibacterium sp.]
MITNYLKTAWRSLMKNKTFSLINIFGLSIGLACCLLISLYLAYELGYDKYHPDADRIYQVGTVFVREGKESSRPNTPGNMGKYMQQEFPEIEETVKLLGLFGEDKTLLRYQGNNASPVSFYENKGYLADPGFFRFFQYHFTEGDPNSALNLPNTVVLSDQTAAKLFGGQPALNKVIHVSSSTNGESDVTVTGVFRSDTRPTHINGQFFLAYRGGEMERYVNRQPGLAYNNMFFTYLKLKKGTDAAQLQSKFPAFLNKYAGDDLKAAGFSKKQFLVALPDIHLRSGMEENVTASGSITYLYILGSVALFSLLIACINFMNLSTARSARRAAEVGIRKVLGANRSSLVKQFLGESLMMSLIALLIAFALALLCLPAFAAACGKPLVFSFSQHGWILAAFVVLALLTGLVAGLYPAFYLSSFKPIRILKSKFSGSLATVSVRKALVVFQFVISSILIISSVVIAKQMRFLRSQDLGFQKEQQLVLPLRSQTAKQAYTPLKTALAQLSSVSAIGASMYYPGIFNPSDTRLYRPGQTIDNSVSLKVNAVDENFIQTLDIKPVAGRLFSKDFPGDTARAIIINEEAVKKLGFASSQDAVGKQVYFGKGGADNSADIVGVVKDFHYEDLHLAIMPFSFTLSNSHNYNYLVVHGNKQDLRTLLSQVENAWHTLIPNEPLEYQFMDEQFQKNYEAQDKLAWMVGFFTVIAILISCLGLFGLATFSAEQRTKEIGIRKVLGASVSNIILLISKDFIQPVLIAIVIASPAAWWIMHTWLQDFAYRTGIGWTVFLLSGLLACLVAFITISSQSLRAAVSNPVNSLRTE